MLTRLSALLLLLGLVVGVLVLIWVSEPDCRALAISMFSLGLSLSTLLRAMLDREG